MVDWYTGLEWKMDARAYMYNEVAFGDGKMPTIKELQKGQETRTWHYRVRTQITLQRAGGEINDRHFVRLHLESKKI